MNTTSTDFRELRDLDELGDTPRVPTGLRVLGLGRTVGLSAGPPKQSRPPEPHDDPALTVLMHLR
ncbi:hypothetical protein I3F58_20580 [Streptomyces sp. MUM 203J]|uniref:hypothetical protein n=1 Tax=Streptomyces sp. MUM 203J TaxID=2791990 RepID=UPI001F04CDBA|nr:hypothetical protein [Streptomyces sp. MUM 203J]MCH0541920.1 hypothetical protein [Streptomyces sp. MUM 203J]